MAIADQMRSHQCRPRDACSLREMAIQDHKTDRLFREIIGGLNAWRGDKSEMRWRPYEEPRLPCYFRIWIIGMHGKAAVISAASTGGPSFTCFYRGVCPFLSGRENIAQMDGPSTGKLCHFCAADDCRARCPPPREEKNSQAVVGQTGVRVKMGVWPAAI